MKNILLIGPPGSGKSTIGRALSKSLKRNLVDTDALIEKKTQRKIAEIFVDQGESFFRELEASILGEVLLESNQIISLGGGAPVSVVSQNAISESGSFVVFLDVSLATAAPRVGFNRDRPLLLGNPRAQWQALYEKRRPIYEKLATISINVDNKSVDAIVSQIKKEIS